MDFLSRTINFEYKLTDLEDELVRYVIENKEEVSKIKVTELAKKFYTVPNTITRLCHKLEYSGFSELKNELKHELRMEDTINVPQKDIILRNFELIDDNREKKVVQLLKEAKEVNFFSVGQTAYATRVFVDNFNVMDYKFHFYQYANEVRHKISNSSPEVFFFISLSGEKQQVLELARLAKEHYHTIITLTGLHQNSLAKLADTSLYCFSPEEIYNDYNITDKTPLLIIMNSLFRKYISEE